MKSRIITITIYLTVFSLLIVSALATSKAATVLAEQTPLNSRKYIIIDAGHGGIDGGTTSCTGMLESHINLQIAQKLNDLMHLLGVDTIMIRTDDRSVYTEGDSIAAKKVSDLKERLRIMQSNPGAVFVSIHQNYFSESRYGGAQVFYAKTPESRALAESLQKNIVTSLNPGSKRSAKTAKGIYLLEHAKNTAVLIECGFLSNPEEEAKLRSADYQRKLCSLIGATISQYLSKT